MDTHQGTGKGFDVVVRVDLLWLRVKRSREGAERIVLPRCDEIRGSVRRHQGLVWIKIGDDLFFGAGNLCKKYRNIFSIFSKLIPPTQASIDDSFLTIAALAAGAAGTVAAGAGRGSGSGSLGRSWSS